jgi:hypothetical protein
VNEIAKKKSEWLRKNNGRKEPSSSYIPLYHDATARRRGDFSFSTLGVQYFIARFVVAVEIVGGVYARLKKR